MFFVVDHSTTLLRGTMFITVLIREIREIDGWLIRRLMFWLQQPHRMILKFNVSMGFQGFFIPPMTIWPLFRRRRDCLLRRTQTTHLIYITIGQKKKSQSPTQRSLAFKVIAEGQVVESLFVPHQQARHAMFGRVKSFLMFWVHRIVIFVEIPFLNQENSAMVRNGVIPRNVTFFQQLLPQPHGQQQLAQIHR